VAEPHGFAVDIYEAQKAAEASLPNLAGHLRSQVSVLMSHEGLHGSGGNIPAVANVQQVYAGYTDVLGEQLRRGCDVIDGTAQALREIVALYRRADGQG
jgi:hypothetical protein